MRDEVYVLLRGPSVRRGVYCGTFRTIEAAAHRAGRLDLRPVGSLDFKPVPGPGRLNVDPPLLWTHPTMRGGTWWIKREAAA